jgi:hypothetical protein
MSQHLIRAAQFCQYKLEECDELYANALLPPFGTSPLLMDIYQSTNE